MNKLLLIDGHSILNRAFYGVPLFGNTKGVHTNAVFGFLNMMFKFIDDEQPTHFAVAFDVHQPTFRHEMFKEYKGTRKPMLPELREQVPIIKDLLKKMNITVIELPGYEADDVIGTMCKEGEKEGMDVCIYSGDRDLLQLASEKITVCIPKTKKGQTTIERYNTEDVKALYKVTPLEFIDVKALMGDSSDNIPGVPGIGEKGATAIISQFGSIENALEHADEISNTRNRNALINNFELAKMSKVLATINIESPVGVKPSECVFGDIYTEEALDIIKELELKSMISRFSNVSASMDIEENFKLVNDYVEAEEIFNECINNSEQVGLFILNETDIFGIGLCLSEEKIYYIPVVGFITKEYIKDKLKEMVDKTKIYTTDIKENNNLFETSLVDEKYINLEDLGLMQYLINPNGHSYNYDDVARDYLSMTVPTYEEIFPKTKKKETPSIEIVENQMRYACYNAFIFYKGFQPVQEKLKELEMEAVYNNIEKPLSIALFNMENIGIKVDGEALKKYGDELGIKIADLEKKIYESAGHEFNINSPKQLGEILFGEMGLPGGKKTKTGYSTSVDVLNKLKNVHPIIDKVLNYRTLSKLYSTYIIGLQEQIFIDGKTHTIYNQALTQTGRLSSTDPNLQNIPVKTEAGKLIRKAFVPEYDYLISFDYSQIELRVLAHLANVASLIDAFNHDKDIHRHTASVVFGVSEEEVTSTMRRNAKAVNFGIIYGMSDYGLAEQLGVTVKEAKSFIEKYFEKYAEIKDYMNKSIAFGKENGYVSTVLNRKRYIPEINEKNYMRQEFGKRLAMNSPIQGSAADIIKLAMIKVDQLLKENHMKSKMILQVHDELIFDVYQDELDKMMKLVKEGMESAYQMKVELKAEGTYAKNWYELK